MEYEFRQFGEGYHDRECFYWLYPVVRNSSPIGLVEFVLHEWRVFEWRLASNIYRHHVATLPGDMPIDEVRGVAKMLLLRFQDSH